MDERTRELLRGHRQASYSVTLLDREDRPLRVLDGVTGGSIELSATSALRGSGTLELQDTGEQIDWGRDRVRIDYRVQGGPSWGLGVWMLSAPTAQYTASGRSWSVELLPKLDVLAADRIVESVSFRKGLNVVDTAYSMLTTVDERSIVATPSGAQTSGTLVWPPGTPKLTIVNDLLGAANYWGLWCDGDGRFRIEPYIEPAHREPVWRFEEGETAIHLADWSRDLDIAAIPNRYVCVGQAEGDRPALVGVAANEDRSSPYSYWARGRWVTETEEGVEAASQAALEAIARRKLLAKMSARATVSIEHMPVPLDPNQVVDFVSQGVHTRASVRSIQYTLDPGALVKTELVEVMNL